ncbi:major facilitator superfamily domain-containing protein [Hysterangium stoloniferum]|nr:major facilitator superfamily domain-containing protein [Hysterangium stoloniferum]
MYDRFTTREKQGITVVISLAGIIGPFASGSFIPCIPEIAKDLKTSGTVINYTVGAYVFMLAVGNLFWAPYAEFYGRRPVYLMSLPLVCIGSLISATTKSLAQLVIGRCVQAFGASCVLAIGAATISDVYKLEERGTAMGIFFGVSPIASFAFSLISFNNGAKFKAILLGPPLAPITGGLLAAYASWRMTQLFIFIMGLVAFTSIALYFPETSHPGSRGIDVFMTDEEIELQNEGSSLPQSIDTFATQLSRWVWLNPFEPLTLARSPVILFVSCAAAFSLTTFYVLAIPLSYTLGPHYGIGTPLLIGACFIPSGLGSIVGATLSGRLADSAIINGRTRRHGKWLPEDRLMATIPAALILLPVSLIGFAYTTSYIPGQVGLGIVLLCLFVNGMAVDMVLSPAATYFVDVLQTQSAEVMAFYTAFRSIVCAIASAGVLPAINQFGLIATNTAAAMLAWVAFLLIYVTIRNGAQLRGWRDIGFTCSPQDF